MSRAVIRDVIKKDSADAVVVDAAGKITGVLTDGDCAQEDWKDGQDKLFDRPRHNRS